VIRPRREFDREFKLKIVELSNSRENIKGIGCSGIFFIAMVNDHHVVEYR